MRVLAISPVPSHPQLQGNSSRIYTLLRNVQARGHIVHFLYYALEGLDTRQAEAMGACWDAFHPVACTAGARGEPPSGGWGVDDWYDHELGRAAAALHRAWQFDAVIVNYVWMSRVLEALPAGPSTLIDTHDIFGQRDDLFRSQGMAPAWFFTTPDEEARGLARAEFVLAIQNEEARHFSRQLEGRDTRVLTLGHLLPRRDLPLPPRHGRLRVGYLASANPLNVRSITDLLVELQARPADLARLDMTIGGPVGAALRRELTDGIRVNGPIDNVSAFYADMDVCINPMQAGTGLKIKTLEAVSFGRAVIGMASAWAGMQAPAEFTARDPAHLVDLLVDLTNPLRLDQATTLCRSSFDSYNANEQCALDQLLALIQRQPQDAAAGNATNLT